MFVRLTVETFELTPNERGYSQQNNTRQVLCLTLDASQQDFNERMNTALRVALNYKEPVFVDNKLSD